MPSYTVLKQGFFHGRLYDPDGKRPILHTTKKFPPKGKNKVEDVPSWLEALPEETSAECKKRLAAENKSSKANTKKAASDIADIQDASFMAEGEKSSTVETLG